MLQVLIDNRNGNVWELPVASLTYKTVRVGTASSVEFTFIKGGQYDNDKFVCNPGDVVRVTLDAIPVFYGYVFTINSGRDEAVTVTVYDQLRYLMMNDVYVFKNTKASDIIKQIASDTGLKTGTIVDTKYAIPRSVADGTKLMDLIAEALSNTTMATGRLYVFFDNFGELTLIDTADWKMELSLGDQSLVYDYKTSRSIDSDTYNRIKIVQEVKDSSGKVTGRDAYIAQDSNHIAKWGLLQLYQKVDDGLNVAQINQVLNTLSQLKNRETRSFTLEAIGDIRIRAGCFVFINIAEAGISQYFLVDECTHKFEGEEHTMSITLKVYG
ncbi:XkdQ/YqbQ family protein [Paenibacillus ferrarius]|uniref:XkdQ/YqbQ family protein n=1 Tax=Paenibacillus ferrarius TaxID=1469647 RepID=UPI003D28B894